MLTTFIYTALIGISEVNPPWIKRLDFINTPDAPRRTLAITDMPKGMEGEYKSITANDRVWFISRPYPTYDLSNAIRFLNLKTGGADWVLSFSP
jgi:hypothetical protein